MTPSEPPAASNLPSGEIATASIGLATSSSPRKRECCLPVSTSHRQQSDLNDPFRAPRGKQFAVRRNSYRVDWFGNFFIAQEARVLLARFDFPQTAIRSE